ncbi:hypothetical protein TSUD_248800 [Trifolium subterraneum]|uniref:Uncharacterized protein n=1 Tax=Trifolium subterraneum TaxID=3900 RepID=A0A2Z6LKA6_TRISU|nr:hypothetical protein TSUD_248800 [Trifolium subterraneum]
MEHILVYRKVKHVTLRRDKGLLTNCRGKISGRNGSSRFQGGRRQRRRMRVRSVGEIKKVEGDPFLVARYVTNETNDMSQAERFLEELR